MSKQNKQPLLQRPAVVGVLASLLSIVVGLVLGFVLLALFAKKFAAMTDRSSSSISAGTAQNVPWWKVSAQTAWVIGNVRVSRFWQSAA